MIAALSIAVAGLAQDVDRGSDPDLVAPGMSAFLAFFALAMVVVLLGWSLTRRVRRSEYRNAMRQQQEAAAQEQATRETGEDPGAARSEAGDPLAERPDGEGSGRAVSGGATSGMSASARVRSDGAAPEDQTAESERPDDGGASPEHDPGALSAEPGERGQVAP